jgi:hypothetical protein
MDVNKLREWAEVRGRCHAYTARNQALLHVDLGLLTEGERRGYEQARKAVGATLHALEQKEAELWHAIRPARPGTRQAMKALVAERLSGVFRSEKALSAGTYHWLRGNWDLVADALAALEGDWPGHVAMLKGMKDLQGEA